MQAKAITYLLEGLNGILFSWDISNCKLHYKTFIKLSRIADFEIIIFKSQQQYYIH